MSTRLNGKETEKGEKLTVTLDYGVHDKKNPPYETKIAEWVGKGWIEVRDTKATLEEFERVNPEAKKLLQVLEPKMKLYPKLKPKRPAIFGKVLFNESTFNDPGTTRDGKDIYEIMEEFKQVIFPDFDKLEGGTKRRAYYDILHISCHYIFNRDVFVTKDLRHFKKVIERCTNVVITSPAMFVKIGSKYFEGEELRLGNNWTEETHGLG